MALRAGIRAPHSICFRRIWIPTAAIRVLKLIKGVIRRDWLQKETRCSAIADRPRCRVRYSFRQK